jgi:plastocyanin
MPSRLIRLIVAAATLIAALSLAGAATAASPDVTIAGLEFSPATVTVTAGDTVTWTNTDPEWHSASRADWGTGVIFSGATGAITFAKAGTFAYSCTIHPSMHGTIVVQAASARVTHADSTVTVPASDATFGPAPAQSAGLNLAVIGLLVLAGIGGLRIGARRMAIARVRQAKRKAVSWPRQRGPRP